MSSSRAHSHVALARGEFAKARGRGVIRSDSQAIDAVAVRATRKGKQGAKSLIGSPTTDDNTASADGEFGLMDRGLASL